MIIYTIIRTVWSLASGMFFSIVVGGPVVFHLLILLFSFLKSSFDTLVIVKRAQLIEEKKKLKSETKKTK